MKCKGFRPWDQTSNFQFEFLFRDQTKYVFSVHYDVYKQKIAGNNYDFPALGNFGPKYGN